MNDDGNERSGWNRRVAAAQIHMHQRMPGRSGLKLVPVVRHRRVNAFLQGEPCLLAAMQEAMQLTDGTEGGFRNDAQDQEREPEGA